jgi:hypothetical protein
MTSAAMLRRFFVVAAGVAALVLGLVVLIGTPDANTVDLLAGGIIAAGAGLLALLI